MSTIIFVVLPVTYILMTIFIFKVVWKQTKNYNTLLKSVLRAMTIGLLVSPSVIGTEGFGLPAPAFAALMVMALGAPEMTLPILTFKSILLTSLASICLLLPWYFLKEALRKRSQ